MFKSFTEKSPTELPKSSSNAVSLQSWSVDTEAEQLMDDLFSDIDRILDGGSKLPSDPVKPEYVSLKSVVVPTLKIPFRLGNNEQVHQAPSSEPIKTRATVETQTQAPTQPVVEQVSEPKSSNYVDKILFGVAFASLVGVIGWLVSQNRLPLSLSAFNFNKAAVIPTKATVSEADRQFIAYMQRSLEVIDRKNSETATNKTPAANTSQTPATLPTLPSVANVNPNPAPSQSVIERVYIPVYPPNQPTANPTPVVPSPVAPAPQSSLPAPLPEVAQPPAPPALHKDNSQQVAVQPSQDNLSNVMPLPMETHTLVGLLESGDRSAALFGINGQTQRIQVGEAIGSSGWTLVSVADQKAVIRRNGEVRSIYVGQNF